MVRQSEFEGVIHGLSPSVPVSVMVYFVTAGAALGIVDDLRRRFARFKLGARVSQRHVFDKLPGRGKELKRLSRATNFT
jgi:hypothetical protein